VHTIRGGQDLVDQSLHTKFDTSWRYLTGLRDQGRAAAEAWLTGEADLVGTNKSNCDLREEFLKG
jgi:NTE family protein